MTESTAGVKERSVRAGAARRERRHPALELGAVGAATAALLLAEVVLGNQCNYVLSDTYNLAFPPLVFGGIALGNALGMVPAIGRRPLWLLALGTSIVQLLGLLGLAQLPDLGLLWLGLPFVAFGVLLVALVGTVPLRTIVYGLGLGGGIVYLTLELTVSALGPHLALVPALLLVLGALGWRPERRLLVAGSALAAAFVLLAATGVLAPRSFLALHLRSMRKAEQVIPSIFTPLFRTDLVRIDTGAMVMITNGSRYAQLPPAERVRTMMAQGGGRGLGHDTPYLFGRPRRVLVIGSAEGENVLSALDHGAESVVAVDINPAVFSIVKGPMAEHTGGLYLDPRVASVVSEGRRYLETSAEPFDLITLQGVQSGTQSDFVQMAFLEAYLFTEEALGSLWRRLGPDGMLFFDEYRVVASGLTDVDVGDRLSPVDVALREPSAGRLTLLSLLAGAAPRVLGLEHPAEQRVLFTYTQAGELPRRDRPPRESLVLTRAPLSPLQLDSLRATIEERGGHLLEGPFPDPATLGTPLRDDRPFFMQPRWLAWGRYLTLWVVGLAAFAAIPLARSKTARGRTRAEPVALFLIGVGYMLFVLGIMGPATLLLGEPRLATPVVFVVMYLFGMVGGVAALRARPRVVLVATVLLGAYLVALRWLVPAVKPSVLHVDSLLWRALLVAALILPLAVLAEVPYIHLLGRAEGRKRGMAYLWENVGTFVGIVVGVPMQIAHGYGHTLIGAAIIYLAAVLLLATGGGLAEPARAPTTRARKPVAHRTAAVATLLLLVLLGGLCAACGASPPPPAESPWTMPTAPGAAANAAMARLAPPRGMPPALRPGEGDGAFDQFPPLGVDGQPIVRGPHHGPRPDVGTAPAAPPPDELGAEGADSDDELRAPVSPGMPGVARGEPRWWTDEVPALLEAQRLGRPLVIDLWANWCPGCRLLDATTLSDPAVRVALEGWFVPVKLDVSEDTARSKAWLSFHRVYSLPAVLVLDAQGRETGRMGHYLPPDEFLGWLAAARAKVAEPPAPARTARAARAGASVPAGDSATRDVAR